MAFKVTELRNLESVPVIRGTKTYTQEALKRYDPQYTGYTEIFVLKLPKFMEESKDAALKQHAKNLKTIIEFCSTSYSGEPELTPDSAQVQMGGSDQQISVHTKTNIDGTSFSINCLETRHEPLRRAVEAYLTSLDDPVSHVAIGLRDAGLEKALENYTLVIAIVQMDPTITTVQNITVWEAVQISGAVDRDNLNYTAGDVDIVQPKSLQMSGIPRIDAMHYLPRITPLLEERLKLYTSYKSLKI